MTLYQSAVPHAYPCAHCPLWVRPDGRGGWVHVDNSYACRDLDRVHTGRYAAPRPLPEPPRPPGGGW